MYNFVYCFDKKYTYQGLLSIFSLLEQIKNREEIAIHIIHEDKIFLEKKLKKLSVFNNLKITIYKFNIPNIKFPNLDGTHVSLATYYRLFLNDYINSNIENIIYVDADMYFLKSPLSDINKAINDLESSEFCLAAYPHEYSEETNKRLKLKNKKYFNAGFLIINFKKFINTYSNIFVTKMQENYENIIYWDQDVLNIAFDGNFLELDQNLNYHIKPNESVERVNSEVVCLHYMGNIKPWTLNGLDYEFSKYYQSLYSKLTNKKYHIQFEDRSIKSKVSDTFYKLDFLNRKYPINYLFQLIKILIIKVLKIQIK